MAYMEIQSTHLDFYFPDKRKNKLFRDYLVFNISHCEKDILNFRLSEYQKSIAIYAFERYVISYLKLSAEVSSMFSKHFSEIQASHLPDSIPDLSKLPQFLAIIPDSIPQTTKLLQFKSLKVPNIPSHKTAGTIQALFFYFLYKAKDIQFPQKAEFKVLFDKSKFTGSWVYIYNLFRDLNNGTSEIMNITNLEIVIPMLKNHKTAQNLAKTEMYLLTQKK